MKKENKQLSYESDGKMGKRVNHTKKDTKNNKEDMFFNTTQSSE